MKNKKLWIIISIIVIIILIGYFTKWFGLVKPKTGEGSKCTYERTYYPCGIPGCENVTETVESTIVNGKCLEKVFPLIS